MSIQINPNDHVRSQIADLKWNIEQTQKQIESCKKSISIWELVQAETDENEGAHQDG